MYAVEFAEGAVEDLKGLRPFDQGRILPAIETRLADEPTTPTRNRKQLRGLIPPFEATPPVWELRVGGYRISYDVVEDEKTVYVRAIRRKPPHTQTEEVL